MKKYTGSMFFLISFLVIPTLSLADDLEMINRPVNAVGLTGLLFTTAPYTVPFHTTEIGVGAFSESSTVPSYTLTEIPSITISYGLHDDVEIALKGSYFRETLNVNSTKLRGTGNTELSYKWNFYPQTESSSLPALALIVTGIAPTSDRDISQDGIVHWGARIGLSLGREVIWGDHVVGVYADGQLAVHDLTDPNARDRYGIFDAGFLLPISKYRNLQLFLEYNRVSGVDKIMTLGGDFAGITYGLRLVNERFNITIGTQFLHKEAQGFENSSRMAGVMSIKL